jgi:hypothetical protein
MARRFRPVVSKRVELIDTVREALDRRAGDDFIWRSEEDCLPHLVKGRLWPRANALCDRLHYAAVDAQGSSSCSGSLQRANKDNHVGDFFDGRQAADQ